jgi:uncharacterized surface protein with fasciclin (FAS1) repeats
MSENTHNKIQKSTSSIKRIFLGMVAFTLIVTSLTGYSIIQDRNDNPQNSQASAVYTCSSEEILSGQSCLSSKTSFPKYELKCKEGYTQMDTTCVKFDTKPCSFFLKGIDAEEGFCKFETTNIYGGEILNYDGRECKGTGYSFYRYNVGLTFSDTTGPIVCANTYSDILGNSSFRWMPKNITEISNLETIQVSIQYSPCPVGFTDSSTDKCSRPATIKNCDSGQTLGYISQILNPVKVGATTFENTQNNQIIGNNTFTSTKTSDFSDNLEYLDNLNINYNSSSSKSLVIPLTAVLSPSKNIVETALNDTNFSTLVAALTAADLVTTLQGAGPFTVVAPTNSAFANLPNGVLDALLKPENKSILAKILTYHVIPGNNTASVISTLDGKSVTTVEGSTIKVTVKNDKIILNDSTNVITADILNTNGVIHVIDKVLLPSNLDINSLLPKTSSSSSSSSISNSSSTQYLGCKPCPANSYCLTNQTSSVCGFGSTSIQVDGVKKCQAPIQVIKTTYTDSCSEGYVRYDLTCAVEQFRDRDLGCSYYFASNYEFITAITEANGQCSTGGRTDFESTNIFKVSDLQCAGPGSGWYNYNVAYDPLVCGYNTYDSNNKAAFRWSAESFTKITGLQKIPTQSKVCPIGWTSVESSDQCIQEPIGNSFNSPTPCPNGTFSPANSTSLSACVLPVSQASSSSSSLILSSASIILISSSSSSSPKSSSALSSSSVFQSSSSSALSSSSATQSSSLTSSSTSSSSSITTSTSSAQNGGGVIVITNQSSSSSLISKSSSSLSSSSSSSQPCISAEPGYYINGNVCSICPVGYFCLGGIQDRIKCPDGKTTLNEGAKSIEACITIATIAIANNPTVPVITTRSGGLATLSLVLILLTSITGGYVYYDSHIKKSVNTGWKKLK